MVNVRSYFLQKATTKVMVDEYLAKMFYRAEYGGVDIQKTPMGARVIIYAQRPAMIIGRGGKTIKQLSQTLERNFGLESPQISVQQVENPELNARIMAFSLAVALEKGYHFRRAAFAAIKKIMQKGAVGTEVIISGKLTSERARYEKLKEGQVYKTGQHLESVIDRAVAIAKLKQGIFGVQVVIAKPVRPVDDISMRENPLDVGSDEGPDEEAEEIPQVSSEVTVTNVKFEEESGKQ